MLPSLRLLCYLQRNPSRGERCPGMDAGQHRHMTSHLRPPETHTNVDVGLDFSRVSHGLPPEFEYAVGAVGRALMPRWCDPDVRTAATNAYIARLPLDWSKLESRQAQFNAWREPVVWCAGRCGNEQLALEVLTVVCFADEVAGQELDFHELARAVRGRYLDLLKRSEGLDDDPFEYDTSEPPDADADDRDVQ